jgi:hypothetical protein
MRGKSTLLKLTDRYLLLQSSERSTIELRLFPLVNNTHVVCMVETFYAPIADSRVTFYTTEWQRIDTEAVLTPVTQDWFWKECVDRSSFEYVSSSARLDMCLIKYSLSDEEPILTAEYMTPFYLDEESRKAVTPLLKSKPKTYEWKFGRFVDVVLEP